MALPFTSTFQFMVNLSVHPATHPHPSIRPSVHPSIHPSIHPSDQNAPVKTRGHLVQCALHVRRHKHTWLDQCGFCVALLVVLFIGFLLALLFANTAIQNAPLGPSNENFLNDLEAAHIDALMVDRRSFLRKLQEGPKDTPCAACRQGTQK